MGSTNSTSHPRWWTPSRTCSQRVALSAGENRHRHGPEGEGLSRERAAEAHRKVHNGQRRASVQRPPQSRKGHSSECANHTRNHCGEVCYCGEAAQDPRPATKGRDDNIVVHLAGSQPGRGRQSTDGGYYAAKTTGAMRPAWLQAEQAPRSTALGAVVAYLVGLHDERLLFCSGWAASANEA